MFTGYLIFFPETPVHICCPHFNWLVCLSLRFNSSFIIYSLHISWIYKDLSLYIYPIYVSPLLDMWTADTFSHSVACLSLLRVSKHELKTLTLIKSNFSMFSSTVILIYYLLEIFKILMFTIRLMIYLKLTWVRWEMIVWFVFLHMPNQLMLYIYWNDHLSSPEQWWHLCS